MEGPSLSMTYVHMSLWLPKASMSKMQRGGGGQVPSIDLWGFATGKNQHISTSSQQLAHINILPTFCPLPTCFRVVSGLKPPHINILSTTYPRQTFAQCPHFSHWHIVDFCMGTLKIKCWAVDNLRGIYWLYVGIMWAWGLYWLYVGSKWELCGEIVDFLPIKFPHFIYPAFGHQHRRLHRDGT